MFSHFKETIRIGALELNFLLDGDDTNGNLVQFEMIVPPNVKVPAPHFHVEVDETLYILEGTIMQTVGAETLELHAGDHCFIKRGVVHGLITWALSLPKHFVRLPQLLSARLTLGKLPRCSMRVALRICKRYLPS